MDDWRKVGIGLSFGGALFQLLGVLLFFDKGLLAMGNLLFIAGVVLIIGFQKTFNFFFQKRKWKGTACFFGGIMVVLYGWAVVGMCIEGWGFVNLFGDFFPVALGLMRNMPVIGTILSWGPIRAVTDRMVPRSLPV